MVGVAWTIGGRLFAMRGPLCAISVAADEGSFVAAGVAARAMTEGDDAGVPSEFAGWDGDGDTTGDGESTGDADGNGDARASAVVASEELATAVAGSAFATSCVAGAGAVNRCAAVRPANAMTAMNAAPTDRREVVNISSDPSTGCRNVDMVRSDQFRRNDQ